jgi:hypothetical protein
MTQLAWAQLSNDSMACAPQSSANTNTTVSGYPDDTRTSLDYTYTLDKLSCVRHFYFIHVTFAYLVVLAGFACLAARVCPPLRAWHALFGRLYILLMLWCMATSLLVHNSGLPVAVLVCFLFVLLGITLGWGCIKLHQQRMQERVLDMVQAILKEAATKDQLSNLSLRAEMRRARELVISSDAAAPSSGSVLPWRVLTSYKALHGALMFVSWINVFGRLIGSNQGGDFTCHTFPVYKQVDSPKFKGGNGAPLAFVPIRDPGYASLPWAPSLAAWSVSLSLVPLAGALLAGAAYPWCMQRMGAAYVWCMQRMGAARARYTQWMGAEVVVVEGSGSEEGGDSFRMPRIDWSVIKTMKIKPHGPYATQSARDT